MRSEFNLFGLFSVCVIIGILAPVLSFGIGWALFSLPRRLAFMTRVKTIMERFGRFQREKIAAHITRFPIYAGEFVAVTAYGQAVLWCITVQGVSADSSS